MYIVSPEERWESEKALLLARYLLPPGATIDCHDPGKLTVAEVVAEIERRKRNTKG